MLVRSVHSEFEQRLRTALAYLAVFAFLLPLLNSLIQTKIKDASLFETHPAITLAFIITLLILTAALLILIALKNTETTYLPILWHAILVSGALASALLIWIISPLLGLFMFVLCAVLTIISACVWYRKTFQPPPRAAFEVFNKLCDWFLQFSLSLPNAVFRAFNISPTSSDSTEKEAPSPE